MSNATPRTREVFDNYSVDYGTALLRPVLRHSFSGYKEACACNNSKLSAFPYHSQLDLFRLCSDATTAFTAEHGTFVVK